MLAGGVVEELEIKTGGPKWPADPELQQNSVGSSKVCESQERRSGSADQLGPAATSCRRFAARSIIGAVSSAGMKPPGTRRKVRLGVRKVFHGESLIIKIIHPREMFK